MTERVDIAATVAVLPMHSEVWVAKQMATLDVLSGRWLCWASAWVAAVRTTTRPLGRSFERRFSRLDQQVERIRALWEWVPRARVSDPVGPTPLRRIPMLSGLLGPQSMARAAAWADGIAGFEMDPSPAALAGAVERFDAARLAAGRSDVPYRMTSWWFALGDDAEARLRTYAEGYLGVFGPELAVHSPRSRKAAPDATLCFGRSRTWLRRATTRSSWCPPPLTSPNSTACPMRRICTLPLMGTLDGGYSGLRGLGYVRRPAAGAMFDESSVSWHFASRWPVLVGWGSSGLPGGASGRRCGCRTAQLVRARPVRRPAHPLRDAGHLLRFTRAEEVLDELRSMHQRVKGATPSGSSYRALDPSLQLWVWATLVRVALDVDRRYVRQLSRTDAERYYVEQTELGPSGCRTR